MGTTSEKGRRKAGRLARSGHSWGTIPPVQREILRAIANHWLDLDRGPEFAWLMGAVAIRQPETLRAHLAGLRAAGWVRWGKTVEDRLELTGNYLLERDPGAAARYARDTKHRRRNGPFALPDDPPWTF